MSYGRILPRSRTATTGVSVDEDIKDGEAVWISPPDRVAAINVAVHIPKGQKASYFIETSCSRVDKIGEDGTGGYWDNPFGEGVARHHDTVMMIANAITGIRVKCLSADSSINVCFVG